MSDPTDPIIAEVLRAIIKQADEHRTHTDPDNCVVAAVAKVASDYGIDIKQLREEDR